jgi:hypothetical protein
MSVHDGSCKDCPQQPSCPVLQQIVRGIIEDMPREGFSEADIAKILRKHLEPYFAEES